MVVLCFRIYAARSSLNSSPKAATEFYYHFSQATNYIRTDRIIKDEKWETDTEFGKMDITINLSKPEKDPGILQKMELQKNLDTRRAMLCRENEGYAGHLSHPARQNPQDYTNHSVWRASIIYSIHHMCITMNIALSLMKSIFRWQLTV